ncbi:thioredoxin [Flagelloscypha sp. PMI_526]|nr:thioredoxin [Flagelloscypha sp. PMI_526]
MPVTEIKTVEEFNAAIASDKPSIIDFWATWCGPCKIIRPIFKKFSEMEQFKAVTFYDVDTEIEELEDAGQKAGVTTMPSFIAFHMGERLGIARGAIPKNLEV